MCKAERNLSLQIVQIANAQIETRTTLVSLLLHAMNLCIEEKHTSVDFHFPPFFMIMAVVCLLYECHNVMLQTKHIFWHFSLKIVIC